MKLSFSKFHGTGNDFIIIDNRNNKINLKDSEINFLCNRHLGIGADGLILLNNSNKNYDFEMIYYNSDGNKSSMCGNGGRCIVAFAKSLGIINNNANFIATDGEHKAKITSIDGSDDFVSLKMKDVEQVEKIEGKYFINSGSPHHINFITKLNDLDLVTESRKIRYNNLFQEEGTNVDFVEIFKDYIFIRTYERGVENETLSCGTGAVASALAFSLLTNSSNNITVKTLGGELNVDFVRKNSNFYNIWLKGPASFVYRGEIAI